MATTHLAAVIHHGFWTALDWIYPPECAGCGEPGYRLCVKCLESIQFLDHRICRICGLPLTEKRDICQACNASPPLYDALRSLTRYGGVIRECIHGLKYENNQSLGEFFSFRMAELVRRMEWQIDLVIPVPLSRDRLADRGYNQSALLAHPMALQLDCRYLPIALSRTRITKSQVSLTAAERKTNVAGAFSAVPELVHGRRVLLVDDVTTTGSTLLECSRALKMAGAEKVFCMTLSRPIYDETSDYLDIDQV